MLLCDEFVTYCQNFDFKIRRDHEKNFLWASRLWVGRRKEPILDYIPKNDEKNSGSIGLIRIFLQCTIFFPCVKSSEGKGATYSTAVKSSLLCSCREQQREEKEPHFLSPNRLHCRRKSHFNVVIPALFSHCICQHMCEQTAAYIVQLFLKIRQILHIVSKNTANI